MAQYIEDLVQNIYTNCDMKGLDKLNQGLRDAVWYSGELEKNLNDINRVQRDGLDFHSRAANQSKMSMMTEKQRMQLLEHETKMRIRLHDYEEKHALRKVRRDESELSRMRQRNGLWRGAIRLIGAYFSIQTLRNIIRTGAELQLIQKSITGLTGSGQDWQFLDQQAYKFGLSLKTVSTGYKNFYSSASMAGFGKKQIQSMFSDMLLGARSIGASDQQIGGALLALEQMMSKGRVSMEELRRQLGNALPGAFEIGAKAMGVTTAQFNKMVKAGISAQEFVPKFIKTFKEQYAKGWTDVEQTVSVAQGRLLESWEKFTMTFMHGEAGKALAQGINQLAEFMRSPEFYQFVDLLGKIFTLVVKILTFAIKHAATLIILMGAGGLLAVLRNNYRYIRLITIFMKLLVSGRMIRGIRLLTKAMWGLDAPMLAMYVKLLAVIAALLILEDIYTGLFHPEKSSYTNDLIGGLRREQIESRQEGRRERRAKEFREENEAFVKRQDELKKMDMIIAPDRTKGLKFKNMGKWNEYSVPYNYTSPQPSLDLNKKENKDISVSIGDINVYSNSSNPQEVAQEVQNQLVALFMGQGLMTNVGEMVVG